MIKGLPVEPWPAAAPQRVVNFGSGRNAGLGLARMRADNEFYTPIGLARMVAKAIAPEDLAGRRVLMPCADEGRNFAKAIRELHPEAVVKATGDGELWQEQDYDECGVVVTNPPFTGIARMVARFVANEKPFVFLCPLTIYTRPWWGGRDLLLTNACLTKEWAAFGGKPVPLAVVSSLDLNLPGEKARENRPPNFEIEGWAWWDKPARMDGYDRVLVPTSRVFTQRLSGRDWHVEKGFELGRGKSPSSRPPFALTPEAFERIGTFSRLALVRKGRFCCPARPGPRFRI